MPAAGNRLPVPTDADSVLPIRLSGTVTVSRPSAKNARYMYLAASPHTLSARRSASMIMAALVLELLFALPLMPLTDEYSAVFFICA